MQVWRLDFALLVLAVSLVPEEQIFGTAKFVQRAVTASVARHPLIVRVRTFTCVVLLRNTPQRPWL